MLWNGAVKKHNDKKLSNCSCAYSCDFFVGTDTHVVIYIAYLRVSLRFLQYFVVLTSCIAMLLRIAYRTFFQKTDIVLMMAPKFVETAKWHYAETVIELAWRPLCESFQWDLQMIISGVILATCCIPFKFVGWKLLFACQRGQRSQQAYGFLY